MKVLRNIVAILFLFSCAFVSCDEVREYPWNPEWDKYVPDEEEEEKNDTTETEKPDTNQTEQPDTTVVPPTPEPVVGKARMVWIDAAANFNDYANDKAKISKDMARIKETVSRLSLWMSDLRIQVCFSVLLPRLR